MENGFSPLGEEGKQFSRLGAIWSEEQTEFRLYAPAAKAVELRLYESDGAPTPFQTHAPVRGENGVYAVTVACNLHGVYYTYSVDGRETLDPFARSCGANGKRGVVYDGRQTNPEGWEKDCFSPKPPIIWEVHIRDFSADPELNLPDGGKFSAFRTGVKTKKGEYALVDYLKDLGITYVQLLPVCDFASVDELTGGYNWGYDPVTYFPLEGSYSSNPSDGLARVREFKQLVKTLHESGIGVIMDVVYNHVYDAGSNPLEICTPNLCFRKDGEGNYCNGSGCGNETKSDSPYFRRMMIESVCFFAREYHIDGFRFDLMGLHDVETMNEMRAAVDNLFEDGRGRNILLYGEPWYARPPKGITPADRAHIQLLSPRVGAFSDTFRDGVRGEHFHGLTKGYVQGNLDCLEQVMSGVTGGYAYGKQPAFLAPEQQILYCACHDDYTLFDQLTLTALGENVEEMHKMAAFLLFSGIGNVFLQAGEEFLRSKGGNGNSYRAGDEVNALRWGEVYKKRELIAYYKGLIAIRKSNPVFARLQAAKESAKRFSTPYGTAGYQIGNTLYAVNRTQTPFSFVLPAGKAYGQICSLSRAECVPFAVHKGSVRIPANGVYAGRVMN